MAKAYFVTASAYMKQNLFQRSEIAQLFISTMFQYRDSGRFAVHEYVVMPNHVHVVFSIDDGQSLGQGVQLLKGGFSHALGASGFRMKAVWQPSYYDRRIRDAGEYLRIRNYIRSNPVRRGLAAEPEGFAFSSANPAADLDEVPEGLKRGTRKVCATPA
jgi:putative transposase